MSLGVRQEAVQSRRGAAACELAVRIDALIVRVAPHAAARAGRRRGSKILRKNQQHAAGLCAGGGVLSGYAQFAQLIKARVVAVAARLDRELNAENAGDAEEAS